VGTEPLRPQRASDQDERARRWPPSMVRPSPVQYHATVMVTVALVLVGLAAFAFLSHRGVGPFAGGVVSRTQIGVNALRVDIRVANEGSKAARATCTIRGLDAQDTQVAVETILTPRIPSRSSVIVQSTLQNLETQVASVRVSC
jgi:hypothetical protein